MLTGKPDDINTARLLTHFAVLQANLVGAPRGQALDPGPSAGPSASNSSSTVALPTFSAAGNNSTSSTGNNIDKL